MGAMEDSEKWPEAQNALHRVKVVKTSFSQIQLAYNSLGNDDDHANVAKVLPPSMLSKMAEATIATDTFIEGIQWESSGATTKLPLVKRLSTTQSRMDPPTSACSSGPPSDGNVAPKLMCGNRSLFTTLFVLVMFLVVQL